MLRRFLAGALAAGLLLAPAWAAPAAAADEAPFGVIRSVAPAGDALQVQFRAGALAADAVLDAGSVRVLLDGKEVEANAAPIGDVATNGAAGRAALRRAVLVIDTSGSMRGSRITAAREAGQAYLDAVPEGVEVALVGFSSAPQVLAEPSAEHAAVRDALPGLVADGSTSLYDAVDRSLQVLGAEGDRRLLILSDGEDTSSATTLEAAVTAVSKAGVGVDALVLGSEPAALDGLTRLTAAGSGRLLQASGSPEASAAFRGAAQAFFAGLLVDVPVPRGMSGRSTSLEISAAVSTGERLTASAPVLLPPAAPGAGLLSTQASLLTGVVATFLGLATALVMAVRSRDPHVVGRRRTQQVLESYALQGRTVAAEVVEQSKLGSGPLVRAALALTSTLCPSSVERRLTARLARSGVHLTASEWLVVQGGVAMLSAAVLSLVSHPALGLAGGLVAAGAAHAWLGHKATRRRSDFVAQMPDALQLVASGLSSGYSFPQALDSVVQEGLEPVASEFGRALAEAQLGAPIEDALDVVADRMACEDFRWVVMAVRTQRDVGGNLADVLHTVCQTMRERQGLRRQVQALSAEGRLSAKMLLALPVLVGLYLALATPDFFGPMYQTPVGIGLLCACAVSMGLGALWMSRLVKVEM